MSQGTLEIESRKHQAGYFPRKKRMRLLRKFVNANYKLFAQELPDGLTNDGVYQHLCWPSVNGHGYWSLRIRSATKYRKDEHNMLDRFVVDVEKTFVGVMLRGCEPKTQRKDRENPNSDMVPAQDKNGVPKWTVYLSVETKSSFGKKQFDEMEVTLTSPKNPVEGLAGSYVTIEGLTQGQMPIGKGKAVTLFYTAEAIRPVQSAQFAQPSRVASSQ